MGDAMDDPGTTYTVPDAHPPPERTPCPDCGKPIKTTWLHEHRRKTHGITRRRGRPRKTAPLPGADVVATVLDVVFPKGIPTRHLDAVVTWRDATVAFMKEVQDG